MTLPLNFSSEVLEARTNGQPVVALESTIITHGMPYPDNLNTAMGVENVIRKAGAVPATIAVMRGRIHIGLDADELSALAQTKKARKLSRADLAVWDVEHPAELAYNIGFNPLHRRIFGGAL